MFLKHGSHSTNLLPFIHHFHSGGRLNLHIICICKHITSSRMTVTLAFSNKILHTVLQGSFCVCAQPMRDGVTMQRLLSLVGCIHKMQCATIAKEWYMYIRELTEDTTYPLLRTNNGVFVMHILNQIDRVITNRTVSLDYFSGIALHVKGPDWYDDGWSTKGSGSSYWNQAGRSEGERLVLIGAGC